MPDPPAPAAPDPAPRHRARRDRPPTSTSTSSSTSCSGAFFFRRLVHGERFDVWIRRQGGRPRDARRHSLSTPQGVAGRGRRAPRLGRRRPVRQLHRVAAHLPQRRHVGAVPAHCERQASRPARRPARGPRRRRPATPAGCRRGRDVRPWRGVARARAIARDALASSGTGPTRASRRPRMRPRSASARRSPAVGQHHTGGAQRAHRRAVTGRRRLARPRRRRRAPRRRRRARPSSAIRTSSAAPSRNCTGSSPASAGPHEQRRSQRGRDDHLDRRRRRAARGGSAASARPIQPRADRRRRSATPVGSWPPEPVRVGERDGHRGTVPDRQRRSTRAARSMPWIGHVGRWPAGQHVGPGERAGDRQRRLVARPRRR